MKTIKFERDDDLAELYFKMYGKRNWFLDNSPPSVRKVVWKEREQLIERIMDILGSHNQDLYSSREIANKILEEIEKQE